jgi:tetratricopeptide (TPR) repeat protein
VKKILALGFSRNFSFGEGSLRFRGKAAGLILIPLLFLAAACGSNPESRETPLPLQIPAEGETVQPARPEGALGVADEIRSLTEKGTSASLIQSLELIRVRGLGNSEFGRVMNAVNSALLKTLYPAISVQLPLQDPPQTHAYSKILRDLGMGNYVPPPAGSRDYLEQVLPFLALYNDTRRERLLTALPDLQKGVELNPGSVLAPYFLGLVYERSGGLDDADRWYSRAWQLSPDCYPAALGLARVMEERGRRQDAIAFLSDMVIRFPDNIQVKRQLALMYYRNGEWSRAEPAVAEILQRDSRDGEFILMRAHILVEQGQYLQAQAPLDLYASINPSSRFYLFLRARVQAEGYRNRDAALNYLRSLIRGTDSQGGAVDDEASVYAARLLMESSRPEDQREGRDILLRLLSNPNPSLTVTDLALQDAIRRQAWPEARSYITRLLNERRSPEDLLNAYNVEHGQGNNAAALSYARELYDREQSNDEGAIAYISALIDTGRQDEAGRMIESRLNSAAGIVKSRYYYLRSRIRSNDEAAMNDLRSSLFEDPRNLNALTAMFEIYHRRKDERRAVYYLKQALAIAPDSPQLKRYEAEYATALGN